MTPAVASSFRPVKRVKYTARGAAHSTAPTVHELFSGAGLLGSAFASEGFQLTRAVELDPSAAATYRQRLGDHVEIRDVRATEASGRCDVLVAGPPCQGFSTLGKRDPNDPRNQLSLEVARWAAATAPSVVVIENVEAFLGSPVWRELSLRLEALGYEVHGAVYEAFDFGVPQRRRRSFTLASRVGLPTLRRLPGPCETTVREAWEGLPVEPDGRNLHVAPAPGPLALARMKVIPSGGDKRDVMRLAPELAPPSWWRLGCHVTDVWGRMQWDAPSNTLRTCLQNASKGRYIHPDQHRVISLREAARLQTIDDAWTFEGPAEHVARQIGNSVPPRLGRAVARAVAERLGF